MATTGPTGGSLASAGSVTDRTLKICVCNIFANLRLSPMLLGELVKTECHDKDDHETFIKYLDRLRANKKEETFSDEEWRKVFTFNLGNFKKETSPDKLDVTALFCLLSHILTKVKKYAPDRREDLYKKLRDVKDMRNKVLHNLDQLLNEKNFTDLTKTLFELIKEAKRFYPPSLDPKAPNFPAEDTKKKLSTEIKKLEDLDKGDIHYCISRLIMSGKPAVRELWETKLHSEVLLSGNDKVKRREVFHPLDVMVKAPDSEKTFSYTKIFEAFGTGNVVVVTGAAGAGKTTLVQNIVLQFFDLQQGTANYLSSFNQLVFFECRDRNTKKLSVVIKKHYEDLCRELGKDNVFQALLRIDVLFIIDAFDEFNKNSMKVVTEIIQMSWRPSCRVLITTRPHAMEKKLAPLLKSYDVSFTQYEIMPLTKLDDQIKFLGRYELSICSGTATGEMTKSFKLLSEDVRNQFTEPINLVNFCEIHKEFPDEISSWQTPGDVAPSILRLYKKRILSKLSDSDYSATDVLIADLFDVIGREALELLRDNSVTFSGEELLVLKKKCQEKIDATGKFDSDIILSVLLKEQKPLFKEGHKSYAFPHKTVQEIVAADHVVQRILADDDSLDSILGATAEEMPR
ncbi:uncharacterized protein LOC108671986, partial [Hyalella azteca]|uniref:Uncharacterized protein LOC108671986 n=1 Tax=Hyalella azteca TaxID=294128 RepID=A0A8B7NN31_HYAAZ